MLPLPFLMQRYADYEVKGSSTWGKFNFAQLLVAVLHVAVHTWVRSAEEKRNGDAIPALLRQRAQMAGPPQLWGGVVWADACDGEPCPPMEFVSAPH